MNEAPYRILFVDDEQRMTRALKSHFRQDYEVYTANSGQDALSLLRQQSVDIIVSDQRMPGMLGNEFLRTARQEYPNAIRILLTGYLDKAAVLDTINEGEIFRFINKPWDVDELKRIIGEAAQVSRIAPAEPATEEPAADASDQPAVDWSDHAALLMDTDRHIVAFLQDVRHSSGLRIYRTGVHSEAVAIAELRPSIAVVFLAVQDTTQQLVETCGELKRIRPDLVTIALADMTDANMAVRLINGGQVFRYLQKPLELDALRKVLGDAIARHRSLAANEHVQQRYQVDAKDSRLSERLSEFLSMFMRPREGSVRH